MKSKITIETKVKRIHQEWFDKIESMKNGNQHEIEMHLKSLNDIITTKTSLIKQKFEIILFQLSHSVNPIIEW